MATTVHGRHSRLYIGVGSNAAAPIPKASSNGTAVSQFELKASVDMQEDTGQGDNTKTYVPGLGDFTGSLTMFYQDDVTVGNLQDQLIDAAMSGTLCRFYAYPAAGLGIITKYFYGFIYLSLTSLPADVNALVTAAFDMSAGGTIKYVHP